LANLFSRSFDPNLITSMIMSPKKAVAKFISHHMVDVRHHGCPCGSVMVSSATDFVGNQ
jgi:hypothetical protein